MNRLSSSGNAVWSSIEELNSANPVALAKSDVTLYYENCSPLARRECALIQARIVASNTGPAGCSTERTWGAYPVLLCVALAGVFLVRLVKQEERFSFGMRCKIYKLFNILLGREEPVYNRWEARWLLCCPDLERCKYVLAEY